MDAFSLPEILAWGEERYQRMRREAEGEQDSTPRSSTVRRATRRSIDILRSMMFDLRRISSVNVPNTGYVPNLPTGAVLKIPGVVTGLGLRPVSVPDFPAPLAGIVARRLASVDVTIEAALRGDRDLAVEAMLLDGAVTDPGPGARAGRPLPRRPGRVPAAFASPIAAVITPRRRSRRR